MGWTFTEHSKRRDLIAEITEERTDQDVTYTTLAHCWRGNAYTGILWAVKEVAKGGEREQFILCYLMRYQNDRWGGGWGYKGMGESEHPYYYSCPKGYLEMAPVACPEWREKVMRYHAWRSKPKGLQQGDVLVLDSITEWSIRGERIKEVRVFSVKPLLCEMIEDRMGRHKRLRIPRKAFVEVKRYSQVIQRRDRETGEWREIMDMNKLPKVRTNEIKKGEWVVLRNGWAAQIEDNRKGNTRMATVYGYVTECGSVYSHDILAVLDSETVDPKSGVGVPIKVVEHTKAQDKLREQVAFMF